LGTIIGREYAQGHEAGILPCPGKRLSFSFKKSIDHDGVFFVSGAAAAARCFAANHSRTGIDRHEIGAVRENYLTSVRDFSWIDRAMTGP
jgi:hypothetical protein